MPRRKLHFRSEQHLRAGGTYSGLGGGGFAGFGREDISDNITSNRENILEVIYRRRGGCWRPRSNGGKGANSGFVLEPAPSVATTIDRMFGIKGKSPRNRKARMSAWATPLLQSDMFMHHKIRSRK